MATRWATDWLQARGAEPDEDGRTHEDLGPQLNTAFWVLTGLATVFLGLRIYCKAIRGRRLWWDDYLLIAAWVSLITSAATTTVCVALDYGKNWYDMNPAYSPKMPFVAAFAGFFSVLAATLSKLSFATTLLRLCRDWARVVVWIVIGTLSLIMTVTMMFMWLKCQPVSKIWDTTVEGKCIDPAKIVILYQWSAGWSGSVDVILALLPWTFLFNMRPTLNIKERLGVAIAMSMGIFAGVASFIKMAMLPHLTGAAIETVAVTLWGGSEGAITIMAASIPVLRTLIRRNKTGNTTEGRYYGATDERRLNTTSLDTFTTTTHRPGEKEVEVVTTVQVERS